MSESVFPENLLKFPDEQGTGRQPGSAMFFYLAHERSVMVEIQGGVAQGREVAPDKFFFYIRQPGVSIELSEQPVQGFIALQQFVNAAVAQQADGFNDCFAGDSL